MRQQKKKMARKQNQTRRKPARKDSTSNEVKTDKEGKVARMHRKKIQVIFF